MSIWNLYLTDTQTNTESLQVDPPQSLSDSLSLIDTFTPSNTHNLSDPQTLVESFTYSNQGTQRLSDTQFNSESWFAASSSAINTPIPSVGNPGENSQPNPVDLGPGLGPFTMGALRYISETVTFTSGSFTVTFKAPEFGNVDTKQPKYINEDTRGLQLIQYRDPIWPDFITYSVGFSQLDYSEIQIIRNFLRNTVGLPVTYTDIYGNTHIGLIPDPDGATTSSNEGYSIKFTFLEGVIA